LLNGENLQMLLSTKTIATVILLFLFVTIAASPVWAEEGTAAAAISSAKNTILNCYNAAKEAEAAGANITGLTAALNEAGSLLSQAELAYSTNDNDAALSLATQSQNALNNFIAEANSLKETATQQQNQDFLINVVGSIAGTFAVIIAGFAAWFYLKRKYATAGAKSSESSRV
jgi:hypothetical protein